MGGPPTLAPNSAAPGRPWKMALLASGCSSLIFWSIWSNRGFPDAEGNILLPPLSEILILAVASSLRTCSKHGPPGDVFSSLHFFIYSVAALLLPGWRPYRHSRSLRFRGPRRRRWRL